MIPKKVQYLIATVFTLLVFIILWVNFAKGGLVVQSDIPITQISINGKVKDITTGTRLPLTPWLYKIVVNREYYDTYNSTLFVGPWSTKTLTINLTANEDGKSIVKRATAAARIEVELTKTKNFEVYQSAIKKYLTTETHDDLVLQQADMVASQETAWPASFPRVSLPISRIYIQKVNEETIATVEVAKNDDPLSVSSLQYTFTQTGHDWLITNIIYN